MHTTRRGIATIYLVASIWLFVMLATSFALLEPMGTIYSAIDASPVVRAFSTLGIAMTVATVTAGLAWSRLRAGRDASREELHAATEGLEADPQAALTPNHG